MPSIQDGPPNRQYRTSTSVTISGRCCPAPYLVFHLLPDLRRYPSVCGFLRWAVRFRFLYLLPQYPLTPSHSLSASCCHAAPSYYFYALQSRRYFPPLPCCSPHLSGRPIYFRTSRSDTLFVVVCLEISQSSSKTWKRRRLNLGRELHKRNKKRSILGGGGAPRRGIYFIYTASSLFM